MLCAYFDVNNEILHNVVNNVKNDILNRTESKRPDKNNLLLSTYYILYVIVKPHIQHAPCINSKDK